MEGKYTNIKDLRKALGLTQADLASSARLRPATIGEAEKGGGTVATLQKIADATGYSLNIFFEKKGED